MIRIRTKTTPTAHGNYGGNYGKRGKQAFAMLGLAAAAAVLGSVPAAADDHASGPAALSARPAHVLRVHDDHASTAPRLLDDHASGTTLIGDDHASGASLAGDDHASVSPRFLDDHASDSPLILDDHASDNPLILDDHASGGNDDHASGPEPSLR
ncbi:hypothetical protein ABZ502_05505 [Streptomyces abikoensis]|uniref:hypothetical protein n=1 Tax=Streptomyces abikoensis TaxID=97398 RepID=UPI0033F8634D